MNELTSFDHILHYGIKGMHWGVRRYQNEDGTLTEEGKRRYKNVSFSGSKTPKELQKFLNDYIDYSEFTLLKSPEDTVRDKKGSCHDQVMLALNDLRSMGLKPRAAFVIEYNPETYQGGSTHSFVYYNEGNKVCWLENSWGRNKGIHSYQNEKEMFADISKKFREESRDSEYTELEITDFGQHFPGETLQELVDKCLNNKELNYSDFNENSAYISHHGIKGQKWGVRNGPPYPLSRQKDGGRNKAEIEANKRDYISKDGKAGGLGHNSNGDETKKTGLTSEQKKKLLIAGVAAVGTELAIYGAYRLYKSSNVSSIIDRGSSELNDKFSALMTFAKFQKEEEFENVRNTSKPSRNLKQITESLIKTCSAVSSIDKEMSDYTEELLKKTKIAV